MKFTIGVREFDSKKKAQTEIRRILHSSPLNVELGGDDLQLISDLYKMHPRGQGTPHAFIVGLNDYHGCATRGFQGIFSDGSRVAFSYTPCLNPSTDKPQIVAAMRAAILPSQRQALMAYYRNKALVPCLHCKAGLTIDKAEVHHMLPKFRDIVDAFVGLIGEPKINTAEIGDDFSDFSMKKRWIQFHDAIAQRVILCAKCNREDEKACD